MKNSTARIGERIREVRVRKNLTQNALCGTELTRNHLSLIESGKSLPSVKTICYIADRLDIPVGYLFSDDDNEETRFTSLFMLDEIKSAYIDRDYLKVISLCERIPEKLRGDEIQSLLSRAHFATALSSADRLELTTASAIMKKAADASSGCPYLSRDFANACEYYTLLFSSVSSEAIPPKLTDIHEISSYVPPELVMYLKMICGEDIDDTFFTSSRHRQHAEARRLINEGSIRRAYDLLLELSELTSLPYYMKFRVFDDLEKCAEEIGEYKTAYSAARYKLELVSKR